jgi:hypothetical protein
MSEYTTVQTEITGCRHPEARVGDIIPEEATPKLGDRNSLSLVGYPAIRAQQVQKASAATQRALNDIGWAWEQDILPTSPNTRTCRTKQGCEQDRARGVPPGHQDRERIWNDGRERDRHAER